MILNDDKVNCEGLIFPWEGIKRVKHNLCNQVGANVDTLTSSVKRVVYQITTEKLNNNTFDSVVRILVNAFKIANRDIPDLKNYVTGLDCVYSCYEKLISFIQSNYGNIFGTLKESMFAPFTYDQKRRSEKNGTLCLRKAQNW